MKMKSIFILLASVLLVGCSADQTIIQTASIANATLIDTPRISPTNTVNQNTRLVTPSPSVTSKAIVELTPTITPLSASTTIMSPTAEVKYSITIKYISGKVDIFKGKNWRTGFYVNGKKVKLGNSINLILSSSDDLAIKLIVTGGTTEQPSEEDTIINYNIQELSFKTYPYEEDFYAGNDSLVWKCKYSIAKELYHS